MRIKRSSFADLGNHLRLLSPNEQRRVLMRARRIYWRRQLDRVPRSVRFGLVAGVGVFALLGVMPVHPLSIPAAIGGGISLAIVLGII